MSKPIHNSKRSIKKRLEKELHKLFPDMAVYVRKGRGFIHPSAWAGYHTYENWRVWIGKKSWSKKMCHMLGHLMDACDANTMFKMIREEQQRILAWGL